MKRLLIALLISGGILAASSQDGHAQSKEEKLLPTHLDDLKLLYHVSSDGRAENLGEQGFGMAIIPLQIAEYRKLGVNQDNLKVSIVIHGDAAYWLLNQDAWTRITPTLPDLQRKRRKMGVPLPAKNPNIELVRKLQEEGVSVEICGDMMQLRGWTNDDLLPGVTPVLSAPHRVLDLQRDGYAYIRF
jgi:intracellular sulfur oxidation DsrE/DsrF family protein